MTIYVDHAIFVWKRRKWCHLFSDKDLNELHEFARQLGLKREWFQNKKKFPHYDITENKRTEAIQLGARIISRDEFITFLKNK